MEFSELIKYRESIRNYDTNKKVPNEILMSILEAGRLAPSASNRQPWTFILVSSEEWLAKIRPCYGRQWFKNAPHILIVKGDKNEAWTRQLDNYNSLETDLTIAMDHLILAAANECVGTCWIADFDKQLLYNALKLMKNEVIFAITPLGYPKTTNLPKPKNRKAINDVATFL